MYSMYKCSSIFQGLLHDELLVSNITFSIVIEKIVVHFCGWTGSIRLRGLLKGIKLSITRRESLACEPKGQQER